MNKVKVSYIEYMRSRGSFNGKHNRRKSLIFYILNNYGEFTSREVYTLIGNKVTYSAIRSSLSRLASLGYIGTELEYTGITRYSLLAKGARFLSAAEVLAPLDAWLTEASATVHEREG